MTFPIEGEDEVTVVSHGVEKHQSGSVFQTRRAFSGTIYPVPVLHEYRD
jgi:hypothetical protein